MHCSQRSDKGRLTSEESEERKTKLLSTHYNQPNYRYSVCHTMMPLTTMTTPDTVIPVSHLSCVVPSTSRSSNRHVTSRIPLALVFRGFDLLLFLLLVLHLLATISSFPLLLYPTVSFLNDLNNNNNSGTNNNSTHQSSKGNRPTAARSGLVGVTSSILLNIIVKEQEEKAEGRMRRDYLHLHDHDTVNDNGKGSCCSNRGQRINILVGASQSWRAALSSFIATSLLLAHVSSFPAALLVALATPLSSPLHDDDYYYYYGAEEEVHSDGNSNTDLVARVDIEVEVPHLHAMPMLKVPAGGAVWEQREEEIQTPTRMSSSLWASVSSLSSSSSYACTPLISRLSPLPAHLALEDPHYNRHSHIIAHRTSLDDYTLSNEVNDARDGTYPSQSTQWKKRKLTVLEPRRHGTGSEEEDAPNAANVAAAARGVSSARESEEEHKEDRPMLEEGKSEAILYLKEGGGQEGDNEGSGGSEELLVLDDDGGPQGLASSEKQQQQQQQQKYSSSHSLFDSFPFVVELSSRSQILEIMRTTSSSSGSSSSLQQGAGPSSSSSFLSLPSSSSSCLWLLLYYDSRCGHCHQFAPYFGRFASSFSSSLPSSSLQSVIGSSTADYMYSLAKTAVTIAEKKLLRQMAAKKLNHTLLEVKKKKEKKAEEDADGSKQQQQPQPFLKVTPKTKNVRRIPSFLSTEALNAIAAESTRYLSNVGNGDYEAGSLKSERQKRNLAAYEKTIRKFRRRLGVRAFPKQFYSVLSRNVLFGAINCAVHTSVCEEEGVLDVPAVEALAFSRDLGLSAHGDADYYYDGGDNAEGGTNETEDGGEGGIPHTSGGGEFGSAAGWIEQARVFSLTFPHLLSTVKRPEVSKVERGGETKISTAHTPHVKEEEEGNNEQPRSRGNRQMPSTSENSQTADDIPITPRMGVLSYPLHSYVSYSVPVMPVMAPPKPNVNNNNNKEEEEVGSGRKEKNDRAQNEEPQVSGNNAQTIKNKMGGGADEGRADTNLHAGNNEKDGRRQGSAVKGTETRGKGPRAIPKGAMLRIMLGERTVAEGHQGHESRIGAEEARGGSEGNNDASSISGEDEEDSGTESPFTFEMNAVMALQTLALRVRPLYIPFASTSTSGRGIPDDEKEKGSRVVGGGAAERGKQNVTNFAPRKRGARHRSLEGRQPASSSLSSPPCGLVCELANVAYWDNTTQNTTKINRIGSLRANHFRHFEELLSRSPKNICGSTTPPAASSSSPHNVGTVEAGFTKGSSCFCSNKYFGATSYPYVETELGLISLRSFEGSSVHDGVAPTERHWTGRANTFNLSSSFSSSSSAPISISAVATSTDLARVCGTTAQQPHTPEESPTQEESLLCSQLPLIFRYILHESGKQKELARDRQHQQQNQNHHETQQKAKKPFNAAPFSFFATYALPPMTVAATAESNGNSYLGLWTNSACELDLELSADDGPRQVVTVVSTEGVNNSAAAVNKPVESKSVSESLLLFPLVLDSSTASHQSLTSHRLRHNRIASVLFASAASAVSPSSYSCCSVCEATRHQLAEEKRIRLAVERSVLGSLNKEIQRGFYLTAAAASLVKSTAGGGGDGSNGLDGYRGVSGGRHQAQGDGGLSQQRTTVTTKRRGEKELANIMEQKMTSNKVLRVRPIIFTGLPFRSPFPTPFSSYSYSSKHPTAFGEHIPDSTAGNTINTNSPNSGNRDHTNSLYIFSKRSTKHSGGLRHDDVNDQPCYDTLVSHLGLLRPPALPRPKTLASSLRRQQRKHLIDLEKRTRGGSPKGYPLPTIFSPTVNKQRQKHVTFPRGWGYARQDVANALFYTLWFDVPLVPKTEQSYTTLKNFLTIIGDVLPWTQIGPLLSDSALNFTSVSSWRRRLIGSIVRTGVVVLNGGQSAMDRLVAENEGVTGGEERGQEALPSLRDSLRWAVCSSGVAGGGGGGDEEEVAEEGTSRYQGGQGGGGDPSCGLWLLYHTLVNSALAPQGSRAYDKHYALNPTPPPSTHFNKPPPTDPAQEEAPSEERAAANEPFGDTKRRAAQQDRGQDFTKHQHYRRDEANNAYGSSNNKRNGVYGEDRTMAEQALRCVSDYALLFSTRHTCPSCGVSFTHTFLSTKGGGEEDPLNKLFYGLSNVVGGGTTIQGPHEGEDKTSPEQEKEEEESGDFFSHPSLRLWLVHSQHTRNEQIDSLVLALRQLADWTAVHWEGAIVEVEEEAREMGGGGKEMRKGDNNGDGDEAKKSQSRVKAGLHVEKDYLGDGTTNNTTQRREMLSSGDESIRNEKGSKDGDAFSDIRMTTPMIAPISFSSSSPSTKLKKFLLPLLHNGLQSGHSLLLDEDSSASFPPRALCVGCRRFARIGNARHQRGGLSRGRAVEKKEDEEEPLHHVNSRMSDHTVIDDMSSFSSFFLHIHPSSPSSASSSMSQRQSLPKNLAQTTKATRLPLQEKLLLSRIVRSLYDGFARLVESRWRRLQRDRIEYLKRIQRERDMMLRLKRGGGGGDIRGGDGENEEVPKAGGDGDGSSHVALEVRARTTRRIAELERQLKESSTNDCCYDAPSTGDPTSSLISQRRDARRAAASRLILNEFFSSVLGSHYSLRTDFSDYILLNNTEDCINDKDDGGEEGEASSTAEDEVTIKWNMRVLTHFLAKRYGGGGVDQLELGSARVVAPWEERSGVEDDEGEANDLPTMTAAGVGSAAVSEGLVSAAADDEGKKKRVLVTNNNGVSGREEERRPHDVSVVTNLDNNNNNKKKDEAPRAERRRRDYGHCSSGKAKAPLRELLDWHDASFFAEEENAPPPPPHLVDKVAVWRKNKGESGSHAGKSRDDHDGFEAAGVNGEMSPHHQGKEHADNNHNINNNNGNGLIDDDKKNEKPVAQKIEVPNSPHAEEEGDASIRIVQSNNDNNDPLEAPQAAVLDALLAAPLLPPPKSGVGDNHLLVGGGEKDGVITNNSNNNNDTNETQSNEKNNHHGRDGNEVRNNNGLVLAMSKLKHLVEEEEKKQQQQGQQQIMIYSSTVPESVVSAEKGKEDEKESKGKGEEAAATTPKAPIRVGLTFSNTILSAFVSFVCVCSGYIYGLNIRSPSFSLLSSLPTWAEPIYLQIIRSIQRASRRAATTPRQQQRQRQPQPNQPLQQQGQELGAEEGVEAGELGRGWRQQINVRQHASTVIVIDEVIDEMGSASVARTAGGRSAKRSLTSSSERR